MARSLRTVSSLSLVALTASLALSSRAAWAVTLTVGPGRMYATPSAAAAAARDGDVVEIAAGTYRDITTWRAHNLTIRGVGGMAHLDAAGLTISNGKAIWVIAGRGYTLEHIEFSGARVPDRNGAGIRQEAAGLTVRDCYFHDNENGILTGADATSDIVIEASEFRHNGAGDGYSHNLYIGAVRSLTMRGCYSHDVAEGHLVKSRARANYILYNRITGEGSTDSYEINLPNGGLAVIVGNLIEQPATTHNPFIVSYAEEGAVGADQRFYMVNNTVVNNRGSGTFVRVAGTPMAFVTNNLFIGAGTQLAGTATSAGNLAGMPSWLVNAAGFDYHLAAGAGAIDRGVDPGAMPMDSAVGLAPTSQYVHPHALAGRSVVGSAIDVGAYEFGASADAGMTDMPRDASVDVSVDVSDASSDATGEVPRDGGTEFVPDVTAADVSATDVSVSDVSATDVSVSDVSASDAAADGGMAPPTTEEGCGCAAAGDASRTSRPWMIALAALVAARTRRRRR